MKLTLIITTYNSPSYLRLTLESVLLQKVMPDEVIIADDGSGEETRQLIDEYKRKFPVALHHVWHPDKGFRLAAIRNKAIAKAMGDYIVQIDGDIVMHPLFISDHKCNAQEGSFVCGSRSFVKKEYSDKALAEGRFSYKELFRNSKNRMNALRIPVLTPLFKHSREKDKVTIRGCNVAYWRKDALAINGFNENFRNWGDEDCDFSVRLCNLGIRKLWLKFSAVEYHIYHEENSKACASHNRELMLEALRNGTTRVPCGIVKD